MAQASGIGYVSGLVLLALGLAPQHAIAQDLTPLPAASPRLELGLDGAVAGPDADFDHARGIVVPRLTLNVSPRTALVISGDSFTRRQSVGDGWTDSRVVVAEMHRGLVQSGRVVMSGVVGAGLGRSQFFQPEYTDLVRTEPITVPASTHTTSAPQFTLGLAAEQRVAARLALRQEVRVVLGEVSEFRAQVGVSVPLGRYPMRSEPWRTRDGRRPDSLRNGSGIGALVGAAAMTGFVAFLARSLCEGDCENLEAALFVGAGYGAGAGALTGAIIDSFRE